MQDVIINSRNGNMEKNMGKRRRPIENSEGYVK
jgi:hypothetical protein